MDNIEKCMEQLSKSKGMDFCQQVRAIVEVNLKNSRVDPTAENYQVLVCEYVDRVAQYYEQYRAYMVRLQEEQNDDLWDGLGRQLEQKARSYIQKKWPVTPYQIVLELAEMVRQEAAERICKAWFPYDTPFEAWAYVVMQNVTREIMRRRLRDATRTDQIDDEEKADFLDIDQTDILDNLLTEDDNALVRKAIASLTAGQREVIELHYFARLSLAEIATRLRITENSVYQRHHQALKNLRKFIENRNE